MGFMRDATFSPVTSHFLPDKVAMSAMTHYSLSGLA